jgi:hypothetical protein
VSTADQTELLQSLDQLTVNQRAPLHINQVATYIVEGGERHACRTEATRQLVVASPYVTSDQKLFEIMVSRHAATSASAGLLTLHEDKIDLYALGASGAREFRQLTFTLGAPRRKKFHERRLPLEIVEGDSLITLEQTRQIPVFSGGITTGRVRQHVEDQKADENHDRADPGVQQVPAPLVRRARRSCVLPTRIALRGRTPLALPIWLLLS